MGIHHVEVQTETVPGRHFFRKVFPSSNLYDWSKILPALDVKMGGFRKDFGRNVLEMVFWALSR